MNNKRYPTLKIKLKLSPAQTRNFTRISRWEKKSAETIVALGPRGE